jgi:hypothetical protein
VPRQTDRVVGAADATSPILPELGFGVFGEGDPDLLGSSQGNRAPATDAADEMANGPWFLAPAMRGPFDAPASGTANVGMLGHTKAFDDAASSSTGDIWQQTVDDGREPSEYTPLTLTPRAVREDHRHVHAAGPAGRQGARRPLRGRLQPPHADRRPAAGDPLALPDQVASREPVRPSPVVGPP